MRASAGSAPHQSKFIISKSMLCSKSICGWAVLPWKAKRGSLAALGPQQHAGKPSTRSLIVRRQRSTARPPLNKRCMQAQVLLHASGPVAHANRHACTLQVRVRVGNSRAWTRRQVPTPAISESKSAGRHISTRPAQRSVGNTNPIPLAESPAGCAAAAPARPPGLHTGGGRCGARGATGRARARSAGLWGKHERLARDSG
jgi:hypothetical protein